jgi:hypothetical protein
VETGEKYAGEWDQGKPKWVQSLGDSAVASATDDSPELSSKIEAAGQVRAFHAVWYLEGRHHWVFSSSK